MASWRHGFYWLHHACLFLSFTKKKMYICCSAHAIPGRKINKPLRNLNTGTMSFGADLENGYPVWTSSYAQRTRNRSHQALWWPQSCHSWHTTTHLRSWACTSPTTGAPFSLSTLCGRHPPSPSTGFHSAGGTTLSQGHRPLTSPSQISLMIHTPYKSGHWSKYVCFSELNTCCILYSRDG